MGKRKKSGKAVQPASFEDEWTEAELANIQGDW